MESNSLLNNRFGFDCLLFEKCNLNCKFCLESHKNNKIDINYILSLPEKLAERFKKEYIKYPNTKLITIRIWGGELFFDNLSDDLFTTYSDLIENFNIIFKKYFPNIELQFSWVSNGVFTKKDRVENLLKTTNSKIGFSYDPVDRFSNKKQEDLMIKNAIYFNNINLVNEISITLTKPNIYAFIENKSNINKLTSIKTFDINYYIPNPNWESLLPTDDDLYSFFKWVLDNKLFNIMDIRKILDSIISPKFKHESTCNCDKHLSACKDCITYNCVKSSSIFDNKLFYGEKTITEDNVAKIKKDLGINKRGCIFCEYYTICPKCCWTSILFKHIKLTNCPLKRIYEYINNNKTILEIYKNEYYK